MTAFLDEGKSNIYTRPQYFGVYKAIVTNVSDPENRGRIKVIAPSVTNNNTELNWALPCFDSYQAKCPDINTPVWVIFEEGDIERPVWIGNWLTQNALSSSFLFEGEDIIYSRDGNVFKVINSTGEIHVFNKEGKIIFVGKDSIIITDCEGNIISLDTPSETIDLTQKSGNRIKITKAEIIIENNDSDGVVNINCAKDVNLSAKNICISASDSLELSG